MTSRFSARTLGEHLRRYPGTAWVADQGRQYAVTGPWRKRSDIAELLEISRGDRRIELLEAVCAALRDRGVLLLVLDYGLGALETQFFRTEGFLLVERIVEYERPDLPIEPRHSPGLTIRRYRPSDRDAVLDLERQSFPWLWWNSSEEWSAYLSTREVEIFVGCLGERIIGYAGFVVYGREGHLDRLAILDREQGKGYGAALLSEALLRMKERGARRVALTTQEDNYRSQALYVRNGFRRGRWTYEIHGRWLNTGNAVPGQVEIEAR